MKENNSEFILFKTEDEKIAVDVRLEDDTVWLSQEQMALLFGKAKSTINEHIQNIFNEGELVEALCIKKFGISEFQQKAPNDNFWETQRRIQHEESLKKLEVDIEKIKPPLEKGSKS